MNFIKVKNFLFKYIQTILLVIGLILIDFGVLALLNAGAFLICTGLSVLSLAFLINYEKQGGK